MAPLFCSPAERMSTVKRLLPREQNFQKVTFYLQHSPRVTCKRFPPREPLPIFLLIPIFLPREFLTFKRIPPREPLLLLPREPLHSCCHTLLPPLELQLPLILIFPPRELLIFFLPGELLHILLPPREPLLLLHYNPEQMTSLPFSKNSKIKSWLLPVPLPWLPPLTMPRLLLLLPLAQLIPLQPSASDLLLLIMVIALAHFVVACSHHYRKASTIALSKASTI